MHLFVKWKREINEPAESDHAGVAHECGEAVHPPSYIH